MSNRIEARKIIKDLHYSWDFKIILNCTRLKACAFSNVTRRVNLWLYWITYTNSHSAGWIETFIFPLYFSVPSYLPRQSEMTLHNYLPNFDKNKYATLFLRSLIFPSSLGPGGGKKGDTGNEVNQFVDIQKIKISKGRHESWSKRKLLLLKCALFCCIQD